jgi:sulfite exporter TauE/SafE
MMSLFITALIMGGIGTMHCIGMCGPLALSLPVVTNNNTSRFFSTLLYNFGRIVTYAVLGAIFGIAGSTFAFFGYQQWLSVIMGIGILLFIFLPAYHFTKRNFITQFFEKTRIQLGNLFVRKNYHSVFFIGLLNGLLPCGLVYMALAGAISTGSVINSSLFMAAFGLGTLPVMWSLAFFGGFINSRIRQRIKKLYPYLMAGMAVLLILRGLGLDIPYISPSLNNDTSTTQQTIDCHD